MAFKNQKQRGAFFEKQKNNPNAGGMISMPTPGNSIQQANNQFALPSLKPAKFGRIKKMFKGNKFE